MASEASPPPVDDSDGRLRALRPSAASPAPAADELPIDVELIKVLASDSRRDILRILGNRRHTLTELADQLNLKKATVLEHLQKLVAANLIKRLDEDARLWVYYDLTPRGKRLVRPERTRFHLILGGTAVAAVLVGALLAAATLGTFDSPDVTADEPASSAPKAFGERAAIEAPAVLWRGLDDDVAMRLASAPANSTLLLRAHDGSAASIPIVDRVARLGASDIDALRAGEHALILRSAAGETDLGAAILVQDPDITVFPLALPADSTTVEVALAPPDTVAPERFLANGAYYGDATTITLTPEPDGRVTVGRLFATQVTRLPDLRLGLAGDQDAFLVDLANEAGPIPDAEVLLDGVALGRTDAEGELSAPWPALGEHALRIVAPGGAVQDHALQVDPESAAIVAPRLTLDALDARIPPSTSMRVRADVHNDGGVDELVTVAARQAGALLDSALVTVPAHGRIDVVLEAMLAHPDVVDITVHAARSDAIVTTQFSPENGTSLDAPAPPMAAAPSGMTSDARSDFGAEAATHANARDRVYLRQAATPEAAPGAAEPPSAAKTPGPPLSLVIVAVAILALASRRR